MNKEVERKWVADAKNEAVNAFIANNCDHSQTLFISQTYYNNDYNKRLRHTIYTSNAKVDITWTEKSDYSLSRDEVETSGYDKSPFSDALDKPDLTHADVISAVDNANLTGVITKLRYFTCIEYKGKSYVVTFDRFIGNNSHIIMIECEFECEDDTSFELPSVINKHCKEVTGIEQYYNGHMAHSPATPVDLPCSN
jgi:CYTH domain-containing protein